MEDEWDALEGPSSEPPPGPVRWRGGSGRHPPTPLRRLKSTALDRDGYLAVVAVGHPGALHHYGGG
jgi:hypothetical protein